MCGCTLNGSPAALPLRATIRKNHAVGTGIVRDATGSYQPGFCVGHRVLHLTRGVNLDSSTPQSAPCGVGWPVLNHDIGPVFVPQLVRCQVKMSMTFHWRP